MEVEILMKQQEEKSKNKLKQSKIKIKRKRARVVKVEEEVEVEVATQEALMLNFHQIVKKINYLFSFKNSILNLISHTSIRIRIMPIAPILMHYFMILKWMKRNNWKTAKKLTQTEQYFKSNR